MNASFWLGAEGAAIPLDPTLGKVARIQAVTAEYFSIDLTEMKSSRRKRSVARPRQIAMYLARQLTSQSLPEIGKRFGGRDHTTVMWAIQQVTDLCKTDLAFARDVGALRVRCAA